VNPKVYGDSKLFIVVQTSAGCEEPQEDFQNLGSQALKYQFYTDNDELSLTVTTQQ